MLHLELERAVLNTRQENPYTRTQLSIEQLKNDVELKREIDKYMTQIEANHRRQAAP